MSVLGNMNPEKVFKYFEEISLIPRGSGNTKAVSDYCVDFACKRGLFYYQDDLNNVIIKKSASKGRENESAVVLQGHLDMVAEKTIDSNHDFNKDGLKLYIEDGYIKAKDTTLGGDNGIAIAYALAILDSDDISHPELEVIFTSDEEIGMEGAKALDMSCIKGKYLLNLDSEDEGIFVAGCAGGAKVKTNISYRTVMTEGNKYTISVSGLKGGHSGVEIDKGRGNAIIIMARILDQLLENQFFECIEISGGGKDNAIPRYCKADLLMDDKNADAVKKALRDIGCIIKKEYSSSEPDIEITISSEGSGAYMVMLQEDLRNILFYLNCVPNGIINMSGDVPELVETSLNLGIIYTKDNSMTAETAVRSSVGTRKDYLIKRLNVLAEKIGGFAEVRSEYPEWEFKKESKLRPVILDIYKKMFNKEPVTEIIHAGLECGYFSSKKPDMDIISMGPDMYGIHTVEEKMSVASVGRVYELLLEILKCKID